MYQPVGGGKSDLETLPFGVVDLLSGHKLYEL
jgi:hypothetical protein